MAWRALRRASSPAAVTVKYRRARPPRTASGSPRREVTSRFGLEAFERRIERAAGEPAVAAVCEHLADRDRIRVVTALEDGEQDQLLQLTDVCGAGRHRGLHCSLNRVLNQT